MFIFSYSESVPISMSVCDEANEVASMIKISVSEKAEEPA